MIQERIKIYRVLFKLLLFIGLIIVVGALLSTVFGRHGVTLPMSVSVDELPIAQSRIVGWSGGELLLVHRSPAMLASLDDSLVSAIAERYRDDPASVNPQHRGLKPEFLLVYNYGAAFRCPLQMVLPEDADGWGGGLIETCSQVRYDFAGRLLSGQQGQKHLRVPAQEWRNEKIWLPKD